MNRHHLRAEAIAWPLVITTDDLPQATATPAVSNLLATLRTRSVAMQSRAGIDDTARRAWCVARGVHEVDLGAHVRDQASCLLQRAGAWMELRPSQVIDGEAPGSELLAWRWQSLTLPPLLLAAAATPHGVAPTPHVRLLHRSMAPAGPMAHLHLHAGASAPFEVLWTRLATIVDVGEIGGASQGPLGGGARFAWWLVHAFLARRRLAQRLLGVQPPWRPDEHTLIAGAIEAFEAGGVAPHTSSDLASRAHLRRLRDAAVRLDRRRHRLEHVAQVWTDDPISGGPEDVWPEGRLLQAGTRLPADHPEAKRFWQYVRVKVAVYRYLVSDATTPGISPFVATYARLRHLRSDLDGIGVETAAHEPDLEALGAIEVRTAPPGTTAELLDLVTTTAPRASSNDDGASPGLEWSWTLHFIRARGPIDDPTDRRGGSTIGEKLRRLYRQHQTRAGVLERGLRTWPQLLQCIRGLDLAGDEREGPLWMVAPWLHRLRDVSRDVATHSHRDLRPLRLTLHAGEDFHHLLGGLRHIYEPIAWGLLEPGDRLGHAFALAQSVKAWLDENTAVDIPRLYRLLDLGAAYHFATHQNLDLPAVMLRRWEDEARNLTAAIWDTNTHGEELTRAMDLWKQLGGRSFLLQAGMEAPGTSPPDLATPRGRMAAILADASTARRAWEPVEVRTRPDEKAMVDIQCTLRRLVSQGRLAIEINPSSNMLVGGNHGPVQQPAFLLRPVVPQHEDGSASIPITVNADDPTSFSTCLADELAYAWVGAVIGEGHDPYYVMKWLEDAADASWRYRFTVPESRHLVTDAPNAPRRQWRQVRRCGGA